MTGHRCIELDSGTGQYAIDPAHTYIDYNMQCAMLLLLVRHLNTFMSVIPAHCRR